MKRFGACMVLVTFLSVPAVALAGPPPHAQGAKNQGGPPGAVQSGPRVDSGRSGATIAIRFSDHDRRLIRDWYSRQAHCPPGLAKKGTGCQPPGLAKKRWRVGHPLPRDLDYYRLPHDLVVRLDSSSAGYKFVRVGADILKIAVGTGLVVDAIESLGQL